MFIQNDALDPTGAEVKMLEAMPRRWSAVPRRLLFSGLLVASVAACAPRVLDVNVKLVTTSCRGSVNPLENAAVLRFTVFGGDIDSSISQTSATLDTKSATIPAIPVGSARNIVAEAFDTRNTLVARGETGPMDFNGKETKAEVAIFLRKVNAFDNATPAAPPGGVSTCTILSAARSNHTATVLEDGRVLIAGGIAQGSLATYLSTTEIYDPRTGLVTDGPAMRVPRAYHTATHIPGTKLTIIAGGEGATPGPGVRNGALQLGELFDESTNTFLEPFAMAKARTRHGAAIPVQDGASSTTVFLFGGLDTEGKALNSVEIFDKDNGFQDALSFTTGRGEAVAISVPGITNGIALFGGWGGLGAASSAPQDVFGLSSPDGREFSPVTSVNSLSSPRIFPMVARLGDGSVVVAGGFSAQTTIEPDFNKAVGGGDVFRPDLGGENETIPPAAGNSSVAPRAFGGAVGLLNGQVLIAGGASGASAANNDAFLVFRNPNTQAVSAAAAGTMIDKRVGATYTLLNDGTVLVVGGYNFTTAPVAKAALNSIEVYQPAYVVSGNVDHG